MAITTQISSDKVFPKKLDSPNTLKSRYWTNTLMPVQGPFHVQVLYAYALKVSKWYFAVLETVQRVLDFEQQHKTTLKFVSNEFNGIKGYTEHFLPIARRTIREAEAVIRPVDGDASRKSLTKTSARLNEVLIASYLNEKAPIDLLIRLIRQLYSLSIPEPSANQLKDLLALTARLTHSNQVARDFIDAGVLFTTNQVIHKMYGSSVSAAIKRLADKTPAVRDQSGIRYLKYVLPTFLSRLKTDLLREGIRIKKFIGSNADQKNFEAYLASSLFVYFILIEADKEWCFQRGEELRLELGEPVLRGPVHAMPVAPKSKRTTTTVRTEVAGHELLRSEVVARRRTEISLQLSPGVLESGIGGLTASGTEDQASVSNGTLHASLQQERRGLIEGIVRDISRQNEQVAVQRNATQETVETEYMTEGKDQKLSTTELAFHVVVPAKVSVFAHEARLVWCPRITNPFGELQQLIAEQHEADRGSYETQHYVLKPKDYVVKSTVRWETRVLPRILNVSESNKWYKIDFTISLPLDEYERIDLPAVYATREETEESSDALEVWRVTIDDLRFEGDSGRTIVGTAKVRSADGENGNYSQVTIHIPVMRYTDDTIAAIKEYEYLLNEAFVKEEAAMKSRAVQYANLRRDELIERYEDIVNLQKELFSALCRKVFGGQPERDLSYYQEIILRAIDWSQSKAVLESAPIDSLAFPTHAPDHFLNSPAVRFFLPILQNVEDIVLGTSSQPGLFETSGAGFYPNDVTYIRTKLSDYRRYIAGNQAKLDEFPTEITIGTHLEAILSETEFST